MIHDSTIPKLFESLYEEKTYCLWFVAQNIPSFHPQPENNSKNGKIVVRGGLQAVENSLQICFVCLVTT